MGDKTAIGSDHRLFSEQSLISALNQMAIPVEDMGVFTEEAADYPLFAKSVAEWFRKDLCSWHSDLRIGNWHVDCCQQVSGVRSCTLPYC